MWLRRLFAGGSARKTGADQWAPAAEDAIQTPEGYVVRTLKLEASGATVAFAVQKFSASADSEKPEQGLRSLEALLRRESAAISVAFEPEPHPEDDHGEWWLRRADAELARARIECAVQSELGYSPETDEDFWRIRVRARVVRLFGHAPPTWSGGREGWSYLEDVWGGRPPVDELIWPAKPGDPPTLHCITPQVLLRIGMQKGRAAASLARNRVVMLARMRAADLEYQMGKYGVPSPDSRAWPSDDPIWDDYARPGRTAAEIAREASALINGADGASDAPATVFVRALQ